MKPSKYIVPMILMTLAMLIAGGTYGQDPNKLIRKGNVLYKDGKYQDAEKNYRKALEKNKDSFKGKFNLGDAMYRQNNWEESSRIFSELAGSKMDKNTKAGVYHNLGNSLLEAKDYQKSILAYQNALLNNPGDLDTKYNLEYAKMMLKKQQQQQQQKQDQKKDQQQQKQDQQNQQNQDQQKQDQNKKISKQDAERMLEALKNDEKKTLEKLKKEKVKAQPASIEKDW